MGMRLVEVNKRLDVYDKAFAELAKRGIPVIKLLDGRTVYSVPFIIEVLSVLEKRIIELEPEKEDQGKFEIDQ